MSNSCVVLRLQTSSLRTLAGAESGSRGSQVVLDSFRERVRATQHAPGGSFYLRERRHCLAEIIERRTVGLAERPRVNFPRSAPSDAAH